MTLPRLLLLCLVVWPAISARADEPSAQDREIAQRSFEEGARLYAVGDYQAAIDAFKHAYLLVPEPDLLFNIAQAYRLRGDRCSDALEFYRRYLEATTSSPRRPGVEKVVDDLQSCAASEASRVAVPSPPPVSAISAVPVTPPPEPERRIWSPIVLGTAGVSAVVAGALVGRTIASDRDALWTRCGTACDPGDVSALKTRAYVSDALVGAGIVSIAVGVTLFLWRPSHDGRTTVAVTPTGASIRASF